MEKGTGLAKKSRGKDLHLFCDMVESGMLFFRAPLVGVAKP